MTKDVLTERIKELVMSIEQSAANHNILIGRLNECKEQLQELLDKEPKGFLSDETLDPVGIKADLQQ